MNIFVGNLPRDANEDALRQIFEQYGDVASVVIIKDKFTGNPRGFGFVEMPNSDEASAAIGALNHKDFMGRYLNVNEANPRPAGTTGRGVDRRALRQSSSAGDGHQRPIQPDQRASFTGGFESEGSRPVPMSGPKIDCLAEWLIEIDGRLTPTVSEEVILDILRRVLFEYGAVESEIRIEEGSIRLRFWTKFKNERDKGQFEKAIEAAAIVAAREGKRIAYEGFMALQANYLEKPRLESEKLRDDIRSPEERELDRRNKELQNELLKEQIAEMKLGRFQKVIELMNALDQLGNTKISNWIAQEIAEPTRNIESEK